MTYDPTDLANDAALGSIPAPRYDQMMFIKRFMDELGEDLQAAVVHATALQDVSAAQSFGLMAETAFALSNKAAARALEIKAGVE